MAPTMETNTTPQGTWRTELRAAWRTLVLAWNATQVELHGRYSVKRMESLAAYTHATTTAHAILVVVLTPLPCLLAVAFADSIPLTPPETGLAESSGFWIRATFATWVYTYSVMEQLRSFAPQLPLSGWSTLALSIPVVIVTDAVTYFLAWIAYPFPFMITAVSIAWSPFMVLAIWLRLRTYLQANPDKTTLLVQFLWVAVCQMSMLLIYPAYNAVFFNLSSTPQTLLVLLLPVIKLMEKNLLSFFLRRIDDLKPEAIVFNIEIFNALFVACCMQNADSIVTNFVLVAVDFITACISLRDLDGMLTRVHNISHRAHADPSQWMETLHVLTQRYPRLESLASDRRWLQSRPARQLRATITAVVAARVWPTPPALAKAQNDPHQLPTTRPSISTKIHPTSISSVPSADTQKQAPAIRSPIKPPLAAAVEFDVISPKASEHRVATAVDCMSEQERIAFLESSLHVLHLTEYLLLIEYTEVMIPIVYSLYLIVLFHLPNRAYYPQLKDMDYDKLRRTIGNVMLNAVCELASLVLLTIVLRRKLHASPLHQLAFVLDRQWRMVQSKLVLWVVVTLQSTLYHLGADYSFKFEWLHKATSQSNYRQQLNIRERTAKSIRIHVSNFV